MQLRMMNMNIDILKGKMLEIKGTVKEKWGKLNNNDFIEIEGRGERLFGLLQKKYGYISDKAELEYRDSVELAKIVSNIRAIRPKTDVIAIAFISRYGRPLLPKNQERQIAKNEQTYGNPIDRYSRLSRRNTHLASQ
jgi:uncharacterized protein YjbJ (UPF0337 family)